MGENRREVKKVFEINGANWTYDQWSDGKWELSIFMQEGKPCHPILRETKKSARHARACKECRGEAGKKAFLEWFSSDDFLKAVGK